MENNSLNKIEKQEERKSLILKFKLFFKLILGNFWNKIKKNEFLNNKIVLWLLILNSLVNISNWIILAIFMNKIDGNVILHYNVYFGVDNIGNWKLSFAMPFIGAILFLINVFLAVFFYKNKERIASYVLLIGLFMAQAALILASASVIIINY